MMAQCCRSFDCRYRLSLWNVLWLLTGVAVVTFDADNRRFPSLSEPTTMLGELVVEQFESIPDADRRVDGSSRWVFERLLQSMQCESTSHARTLTLAGDDGSGAGFDSDAGACDDDCSFHLRA